MRVFVKMNYVGIMKVVVILFMIVAVKVDSNVGQTTALHLLVLKIILTVATTKAY